MLSAAVFCVVLGMATAMPQFLHEDPPADVVGATAEFIREYNRLAALAAAAPDIHIYHSDRRSHPATNVVNTHHVATPAHNKFAFQASLGDNKAFVPQAHTFRAAPTHNTHNFAAGHLAGHLAGHRTVAHVPQAKWTGPVSHTVPAGVNGLPQPAMDTPEVAAAKAAHFAALRAAFAAAPARF